MRNSFKPQESNKYLQEAWDKANHDNKKTVVHIDDKQPNLTSSKISILSELKPQFEELKQEQAKLNAPTTTTPPSNNTASSPVTKFFSNPAQPWQKI